MLMWKRQRFEISRFVLRKEENLDDDPRVPLPVKKRLLLNHPLHLGSERFRRRRNGEHYWSRGMLPCYFRLDSVTGVEPIRI
ncbi:hypothetical protein OPV22_016949 [Ensete ventricosum]|uniref:PORR domain-containing protein n=1 Tax=Ensete ventricosum TaxID=4639 RepID=A0AAV8QM84_ENSVE|nr:hypothetical protein OPV22_016949 [Ensete ventricosum]